MEQDNRSSDLFNEMSIDGMGKQYIRSIASWAMVMVVVAVIGYVIEILDFLRDKPSDGRRVEGFGGLTEAMGNSSAFSVFFGIAIGLLINFFLFRFASQAKAGLDGHDQWKLNSSFSNLKAYFMACSIILIIVLVFMLLVFVVVGARFGTM
ncbi:hypothetical protein LZZ85_15445 [Terrimonas sp. NA20]|uniref:Uncharacterized protein n=1 Tax=Terrimonas ginsenosidimutans TaxID=2908004 RepID=A0ABS9KTP8_9BACT|nr:hypothetical protein [Terrimonas ginsenosidimutans]MCG2615694.1 hypothetical protein [Terrimonas ginsenosidimutans]